MFIVSRILIAVIALLALCSFSFASSDAECQAAWDNTSAAQTCVLLSDLTKEVNSSGVSICRMHVSCTAPGMHDSPDQFGRLVYNKKINDISWALSTVQGGLNNCSGTLTFRSC
jgi:hypothetical protein